MKQTPKPVTATKPKPPAKQATASKPPSTKAPVTRPPARPATASKAPVKKSTAPVKKKVPVTPDIRLKKDTASNPVAVIKPGPTLLTPAPLVLKPRKNELARRIETEAGDIKINIYDNGEIDGDTVSIYHNNILIRSHQRLSQKPITITLPVSGSQPHHELVMVAENLGSIPPNTSVMIITTPTNNYEVFISSSKQKNAKVIFDLKN